jgi:hypothetical protein
VANGEHSTVTTDEQPGGRPQRDLSITHPCLSQLISCDVSVLTASNARDLSSGGLCRHIHP